MHGRDAGELQLHGFQRLLVVDYHRGNPDRAWNVDFNDGLVDDDSKVYSLLVRAVRGGS